MDEYLAKPIKWVELQRVIKTAVTATDRGSARPEPDRARIEPVDATAGTAT